MDVDRRGCGPGVRVAKQTSARTRGGVCPVRPSGAWRSRGSERRQEMMVWSLLGRGRLGFYSGYLAKE